MCVCIPSDRHSINTSLLNFLRDSITGVKNIDSSSGCAIIIKVFLTSLKQLEEQPNTVNNNNINNNIPMINHIMRLTLIK